MHEAPTPFVCHVFVCTNQRDDDRKSCSDGPALELRRCLKEEVKQRGWIPHVRISQSGCLGVCEVGPNVMIYPQRHWFSRVRPDDLPRILETIEACLQADGS